jgi:Domain of unknown function (DUF4349)
MTTDAILAELRAVPGAPDGLRERVRALPEPKPRFAWTLPRIDVRRSVLVLAPAVVALAVGSAALHGVLSGGTKQPQPQALESAGQHGSVSAPSFSRAAKTPALTKQDQALTFSSGGVGAPLPPSTTRLNRYEAWLRVRVERDGLSNATTRAMRIARGYGGYVASVDMNTPGKQGSASLVLRVPVTRVEDAVLRLGRLGDVTAQHVRIQDLQRTANVLQRQIAVLQATIAGLQRKLADDSLSAAERLQLQYQLAEAKGSLAVKTKARATTVREGTLATVSMSFVVPKPAAVVPHEQGDIERTVRDAGGFFLLELAWLLYAVVALGPIALLAAAAVFGVRAARRRSDARLLEGA